MREVAPEIRSFMNLMCPKSVRDTVVPILCFRATPVVSTPWRESDFIFEIEVPTKSQEICSFEEFVPSRVKKYLPDGKATPSSSVAEDKVALVPPIARSVAKEVVKSARIVPNFVDI